ncbi:MAG: hypothetical protein JO321_09555 [Solirubrobacterales bacterium]|nr:hypothetical protein [Solirubrobacterales bacterium]MBV9535644.1 hypothetical protein [Solirubrobacterales bacterium]
MSEPTFQTMRLARGKHSSPRHGACVMELASMLAGEAFTDRPKSVSPLIAAFMRGYNDLLDDLRRQDLIAYAAKVVGTSGSEAVELARAERLLDWADRCWGQRSKPRILGGLRHHWGRHAPPTDPENAGTYAIRSIHNSGWRLHEQALALIDELIAMGTQRGGSGPSGSAPRPATSRERERVPVCV